MDHLKTIIATLSSEEQKELGQFIGRQKKKKHRKDLELYKLLQQKQLFTPQQMLAKLYPEEKNAVAYHALRKRLMQHLTAYIILKQQENDPTTATSARALLSLAVYLFDKQAERLGWNILRKAEKLARESEQYDLLNSVYNAQIEHSLSEYADVLEEIIAKRNQNKGLADEEERASIANYWVAKQLQEAKRRGSDLQFDQITSQALQAYSLTDVVSTRPKLLYQLLSITRSAVLAKKDYYSFEPHVVRQYEQMREKGAFLPRHQYYKISLLYMIAQTLYRNRKFTLSVQYLEQLHAELTSSPKGTYSRFYPRYVLLLAMNQVFTGKNEQAVVGLEGLLQPPSSDLPPHYLLNAQLNLAFCYFQQGSYGKANQLLLSIHHSDHWCEKKMGKEWVLKKNLCELIVQYELGNVDLALHKIRSIERSFINLLAFSTYKNVRVYLQFIKQLIQQPRFVTKGAFFEAVNQTFEFLPVEQEDLQAMSFYAWLKSKMVRRPYYEVLLELVALAKE